MPRVDVELQYVEVGRRRTVHAQFTWEGTKFLGTSRCAIQDDEEQYPRRVLEVGERGDRGDGLPVGFDDRRLCGWCFPSTKEA